MTVLLFVAIGRFGRGRLGASIPSSSGAFQDTGF